MKPITRSDVLAYSITAPHLAGGIIVHDGRVLIAQTLVRFMIGWSFRQVKKYCDWRGWIFEQIEVPAKAGGKL